MSQLPLDLLVQMLTALRPKSVLDLGCGGCNGMLIRNTIELAQGEDYSIHDKATWTTVLDGVEIFRPYITPAHEYLYNRILNREIVDYVLGSPPPSRYELALLVDTIKHLELGDGRRVVTKLLESWANAVLIVTPNFETKLNCNKCDKFGNRFDKHLSRWYAKDFESLGQASVMTGKYTTVLLRRKT